MIEHLAIRIDSFPSAANQTQCFTHILNLVAKSILHQFEAPKVKGGKVPDDAAKELATIFHELDKGSNGGHEEGGEGNDDENDNTIDDDEDGLPEEWDGMSEEELASLEESVKPIWLVLTKVSQFKLLSKLINNSFWTALRCFIGH